MASYKLLIAGLAAFLAAAAITALARAPAALLVTKDAPAGVLDASGTLWRGRIALAGGLRADWTVQPLQSVRRLQLSASGRLTGPQTDLTFQAGLRPGAAKLERVRGRAGLTGLSVLTSGREIACSQPVEIDLSAAEATRTDLSIVGEARMSPGVCRMGERRIEHTALRLIADGRTLRLATPSDERLAEVQFAGRRVTLSVSEAGAAYFMTERASAFTIETEL